MTEDGWRQNGELDKRLPESEVSSILAEAAEIYQLQSREKSQAEAALKLFMMAGRYGSLLTMLNNLMAPVNVEDGPKV